MATDLRSPWKLHVLRIPRIFCLCIYRGLDPALEDDNHQAMQYIPLRKSHFLQIAVGT